MAAVATLKEGPTKQRLHYRVYTNCFQILGGAISLVVKYHNPENKPARGICVANHTSPIDVLVVACDNAYALVKKSNDGRFFHSFDSDWPETHGLPGSISGHVVQVRRAHLV